MGVRRAQHDGMGLAGQTEVVAELAAAGEQAKVFLAADGLADPEIHCLPRCHRPRARPDQ